MTDTQARRPDSDDLTELGYTPELRRSLGTFASFAAGFSFVSILTTIFQLFGLGYSLGGAAFFWTWPLVYLGQFLVALCFAEMAARYPISGAIYQWSRRLGGELVGWFGGWFMILAQIFTAAAAAIALQVVLPTVWSGFQIVGDDPALTSGSGAANAVLLGTVLLVITTTINCIGIHWMGRINMIGVTCEIVGVIAVIGALAVHAQRGPQVVFDTSYVADSGTGYLGAFIVSGLMAAYVMVGFGSAGELAEETVNPRRVAPRTIRFALTASAIGGGLMLLTALMAAPSLGDELATGGLPYVLSSVLGSFWGKVLLLDVAVAVFICTLAIQTACSRLIFSMARDHRLPFSEKLSRVNPRTQTPIVPSVLIGVLCVAVLLVNVGNPAIFATLASVCIVLIYLAYLSVTVPMLYQRLRGWPHGVEVRDAEGRTVFSLGRWGVPVNLAAVLYGGAMVINLAWPRAEIYNPSGDFPILQWAGPITIVASVLVGIACLPRRAHPRPVASPFKTPAPAATQASTGGSDQ